MLSAPECRILCNIGGVHPATRLGSGMSSVGLYLVSRILPKCTSSGSSETENKFPRCKCSFLCHHSKQDHRGRDFAPEDIEVLVTLSWTTPRSSPHDGLGRPGQEPNKVSNICLENCRGCATCFTFASVPSRGEGGAPHPPAVEQIPIPAERYRQEKRLPPPLRHPTRCFPGRANPR